MTTETLLSTGQDAPNAGGQQNADGGKPTGEGVNPAGAGAQQAQQAQGQAPVAGASGEAKPAEGVENKDDKGTPAVPEKYEFTMPEGLEVDTEAADDFSVVAKELKLSQKDADKVAQVGAKMVLRQQERHLKQVEGWVKEVTSDPEIGGEKLNENLAVARKTIDTFGTPKLKELLNQTGLGNHPEFVKLSYKIGKAISDDGFVRGGGATSSKSMADIMYPSMAKLKG